MRTSFHHQPGRLPHQLELERTFSGRIDPARPRTRWRRTAVQQRPKRGFSSRWNHSPAPGIACECGPFPHDWHDLAPPFAGPFFCFPGSRNLSQGPRIALLRKGEDPGLCLCFEDSGPLPQPHSAPPLCPYAGPFLGAPVDPHVGSGRGASLKGAKARAKKLMPRRRTMAARKAAKVRWGSAREYRNATRIRL